jgi:hypothetical protein
VLHVLGLLGRLLVRSTAMMCTALETKQLDLPEDVAEAQGKVR